MEEIVTLYSHIFSEKLSIVLNCSMPPKKKKIPPTTPQKSSEEMVDIIGMEEVSRAECVNQLYLYIKVSEKMSR